MTGRKRTLLAVVLLVVLAATGTMTIRWALTPPPGITLQNAGRLYVGMTRDAVAKELGSPGIPSPIPRTPFLESQGRWLSWKSADEQVMIEIAVDESVTEQTVRMIWVGDRVSSGGWERVPFDSIFARLRRWLGL